MLEFCVECIQSIILTAALAHGLPKPSIAGPITPRRMLCIARRESTFNRYAYNAGNVGLFQLGPYKQYWFNIRMKEQGLEPNLYDPSQQANFAADELVIDPLAWSTIWSC